ncbi:hypothetical protein AGLY_016445, partial [Aphis glycines]
MLRLVNNCLKLGTFPEPWKNARIVELIKHRDKDPLVPKSYRLISLLPVLGKILEEVICDILEKEIGSSLSTDQHGFRPGKSTSSALSEVQEWTTQNGSQVLGSFLDISGAFDNVRWHTLIEDLHALRCSSNVTAITMSYLSNRTATYPVGGSEKTITLTRGCPQDSKFGPRLWNVAMDPLLKESYPEGTKLVAYADENALLVRGNTRSEVINKTEESLKIIASWATHRGLKFSKEKSVMVPLKGGLVPGFTAAFDGERIKSVYETKYLGLYLAEGFNFHSHATGLLDSSTDVFSRIKSLRKSKWGVSSALALIIYKAVYVPRILYGASIWFPSVANSVSKRKMESAQRRVFLAVTGAYNTVSTRALQVLAGLPPIYLLIESVIRIKNGMSRSKSESILVNQWQHLWDTSTKGRRTHKLFPDIRVRVQAPIPFGHYLSQMITDH